MDSRYEERRRYVRYNIKANAILKTKEPTPRTINVDVVDISFSGFSCSCKEKIEPGIGVHFEMETRFFTHPVIGDGLTKNLRQVGGPTSSFFRVGIEFVEIDQDILQSILTALQRMIAADKIRAKSQKRPIQPWDLL